jgi:hypothetical protein
MGKDWSGEGEGPGEEGLRWYPVLPTPAAKQDTDNPSFIYEGSLCPPSNANMIKLNMNPVSVACAVLDKSLNMETLKLSVFIITSDDLRCVRLG